jgi:hypothetical protein
MPYASIVLRVAADRLATGVSSIAARQMVSISADVKSGASSSACHTSRCMEPEADKKTQD